MKLLLKIITHMPQAHLAARSLCLKSRGDQDLQTQGAKMDDLTSINFKWAGLVRRHQIGQQVGCRNQIKAGPKFDGFRHQPAPVAF